MSQPWLTFLATTISKLTHQASITTLAHIAALRLLQSLRLYCSLVHYLNQRLFMPGEDLDAMCTKRLSDEKYTSVSPAKHSCFKGSYGRALCRNDRGLAKTRTLFSNSPTTREYNIQLFHKDQTRKPKKSKVLTLDYKEKDLGPGVQQAGVTSQWQHGW